MKKRIYYIDSVRGIGILLIVLGHILPMNENRLSIWLFSFHVPLFFMISGALFRIKNKKYPLKELIGKRLKGIMYPYVVFSIAAFLSYAVLGLISHDFFMCKEAAIKTINLSGFSALWFLPTLFFSEIIFVFIINRLKHVTSIVLSLIMIILLGSYFDIRKKLGIFEPLYYMTGRTCIGILMLLLGYDLEHLQSSISFLQNKHSKLIIGVVLFLINCVSSQFNIGVDTNYFLLGNPFWYFLNAFFGSYSLYILCKELLDFNNPLIFWGKNSLLVMATHQPLPILLFLKLGFQHLGITNNILFTCLVFLGCILIEYLIVVIVNKHFPFLIRFKPKTY